jgi:hypothetical protein
MGKQHSTNRAIFVLESPWELDAGDANRSSVLPFIEGVGKFAGDVEVLHANFYDESSFEKALSCLAKTRYKNAILYVAAHGSPDSIGNVKTRTMLSAIGEISKGLNITGLLLGACLAGKNTVMMEVYSEGTNLRWCAGYSTKINWLDGTLLDSAILAQMLHLDEEDFENAELIVDAFAEAIAPFSRHYGMGIRNRKRSLDESLEVVVRPKGKGKRAKLMTGEVFKQWEKKQLGRGKK